MAQRTVKTSRKRRADQQAALDRTFGDLQVVDAKADIRIPIIAADVASAERKNPELCALAQACKREFGSSAAVFFKRFAYVDILGEDGARRVERFVLNGAARALVEAFDRGKKFPTGGRWLVLKAPSRAQTLDAGLRRHRRRRAALRKGTYRSSGSRTGISTERGAPRDLEVRNGSGQWQMIKGHAKPRKGAA